MKGVGQTTGDTYVGNGHSSESFNDSLTNGQATESFVLHENFNGPGVGTQLDDEHSRAHHHQRQR